ncbi:hypothetical protein MMPV_006453 [Pyropia vietnamensis]
MPGVQGRERLSLPSLTLDSVRSGRESVRSGRGSASGGPAPVNSAHSGRGGSLDFDAVSSHLSALDESPVSDAASPDDGRPSRYRLGLALGLGRAPGSRPLSRNGEPRPDGATGAPSPPPPMSLKKILSVKDSSGMLQSTAKTLRWGRATRGRMRRNRQASFSMGWDDDDAASGGQAYDPLALLKKTVPLASTCVELRHGRLFKGWYSFSLEVRGETVLLYDSPEGVWAETHSYSSLVAMFSLIGTTIQPHVGQCIRVCKEGESSVIDLRFSSDEVAAQWETLLRRVADTRKVGIRDFDVIAAIGKGASGRVFLVRDVLTGMKLALKAINKSDSVFECRSSYRHAVDERLAMALTDGQPCFVQLRFAFQTKKTLYLATEFCEGGDLFYYIMQNNGGLDEKRACFVVAEVILALEKLHNLGIIYRDLKPENILLDAAGHVRIADFGLCKLLHQDIAQADDGVSLNLNGEAAAERPRHLRRTRTVCGTHSYVAPEMLGTKGYGHSIDVWCLGIFLYHIMVGRPPFDADDVDEVKRHFLSFNVPYFDDFMSLDAIALLQGLLNMDCAERLGCGPDGLAAVKAHPFFKTIDWEALASRSGKHEGGLFTGPYAKLPNASRSVGGTSVSGSMVAPADDDARLLRNFDLMEWADVTLDEDRDDPAYGDGRLFPIFKARKRAFDNHYLSNFAFCAASSTRL